MNVLLVEDDIRTLDFVCNGLTALGHAVDAEPDGRTGLLQACAKSYDVLVIDRLLPSLDGLSLLRALRTASVDTPVIFLTALGGIADRVEGLRHGADDYLVKPFALEELDARIHALGRRPPIANAAILLRRGGLELDRLGRKASFEGLPIECTTSEFGMLELLMINSGRPVTKAMLMEHVFNLEASASDTVVEPHISRLRAKLVRLGVPDPIRTHRGVGYSVS